MRNNFIKELVLQAASNDRIWLLSGDLGFSVLEPFIEKFQNDFQTWALLNKIWQALPPA